MHCIIELSEGVFPSPFPSRSKPKGNAGEDILSGAGGEASACMI
jgi:hypothetical protein